jgi:CRP-like cAMP-binding protein
MTVSCQNCPLRRQAIFDRMTEQEVQFMAEFKSGELTVNPGAAIFTEGTSSAQLYTVLRGMGIRYKSLPNGHRQVLGFILPGDLLGLQAGVMGENGHSVEATTSMQLCVFDRRDLWTLYRSHPSLAYDLTWAAAVEEHFLGETITTIGQMDAIQRLAWAMTRLYLRMRALDMGTEGRVPLPFKQRDMADALGLSLVHTNKTLRKLSERQMADWKNGSLHVYDLPALAALAMVDLEAPMKRPLL